MTGKDFMQVNLNKNKLKKFGCKCAIINQDADLNVISIDLESRRIFSLELTCLVEVFRRLSLTNDLTTQS